MLATVHLATAHFPVRRYGLIFPMFGTYMIAESVVTRKHTVTYKTLCLRPATVVRIIEFEYVNLARVCTKPLRCAECPLAMFALKTQASLQLVVSLALSPFSIVCRVHSEALSTLEPGGVGG